MEIFPTTTLAIMTSDLAGVIAANVLVVVGVIVLGVAIGFVLSWFNKGTKEIDFKSMTDSAARRKR